jgi:hypothetical protein
VARAEDVEIHPGLPSFEYKTIRRVEAKSEFKVHKGLPTAEDASSRLRALAARLGANAVVNAMYQRTTSSGSYGGITATGLAVVLPEDIACPTCAETIKRKAQKCRFCGEALSAAPEPVIVQEPADGAPIGTAPLSRSKRQAWPTWRIVVVASIGAFVLLFIVAGIASEAERKSDPIGYARRQAARRAEAAELEQEKQSKLAAEKQAEADEVAAAALQVERERHSGMHCLSGWDGSNRSTVQQVKERLRDPSSFQHVETRIAPDGNGSHKLVMTYRAKNGFGGLNVEQVGASVDSATCEATLVVTE